MERESVKTQQRGRGWRMEKGRRASATTMRMKLKFDTNSSAVTTAVDDTDKPRERNQQDRMGNQGKGKRPDSTSTAGV